MACWVILLLVDKIIKLNKISIINIKWKRIVWKCVVFIFQIRQCQENSEYHKNGMDWNQNRSAHSNFKSHYCFTLRCHNFYMAEQTENNKYLKYNQKQKKNIFNYFMGQVNDIPFNISYSKFKNINAF